MRGPHLLIRIVCAAFDQQGGVACSPVEVSLAVGCGGEPEANVAEVDVPEG